MAISSDYVAAKRAAYADLAEYAKWGPRRNQIVLAAKEAGIPPAEIAVLIGVGRSHVYWILGKARQEAHDAAAS